MIMTQDTEIEVTGFASVPPFARGQVRDLRVRWALEEVGLPYHSRLVRGAALPVDYLVDQPFAQVPCYREGELRLFECGAIALHIAEKDERLLPRDPYARGRAISWLFAALNTIDPISTQLAVIDIFNPGADWGVQRRPAVVEMAHRRLAQLAAYLGGKTWLEGEQFTVGDLMMAATLRGALRPLLADHPTLAAYVDQAEARPAFAAAMAAHLADLDRQEELA